MKSQRMLLAIEGTEGTNQEHFRRIKEGALVWLESFPVYLSWDSPECGRVSDIRRTSVVIDGLVTVDDWLDLDALFVSIEVRDLKSSEGYITFGRIERARLLPQDLSIWK